MIRILYINLMMQIPTIYNIYIPVTTFTCNNNNQTNFNIVFFIILFKYLRLSYDQYSPAVKTSHVCHTFYWPEFPIIAWEKYFKKQNEKTLDFFFLLKNKTFIRITLLLCCIYTYKKCFWIHLILYNFGVRRFKHLVTIFNSSMD